jgi:exodeoxyribonuclease VII small subunit
MSSKKNPQQVDSGFDFEATIKELESIARTLEEQDTSLEHAMKAFEDGVRLTRETQQFLEKTEQRLQLLLQEDGEPVAADFDQDSADQ